MVQYFKNRFDTSGFFSKENPKIYNFVTCAGDFLDNDVSMSIMDDTKFKEYAYAHPEKNMVELFQIFNFPVPSNEKEKHDPRFCNDILYERDLDGNLIPRENIYYCEKFVKGYKSPLKPSSYSILSERTLIDQSFDKEKNFDKLPKRKKLDNTINNLQRTVRKSFQSMNEFHKNKQNLKKLRYEYCIRYYMKELGNKELDEIILDDVNSLGKIYYIIKTAIETDYLNNPFRCFDSNPIFNDTQFRYDENIINNECIIQPHMICQNQKKVKIKKVNIDALVKNANLCEYNFGFTAVEKGDSQKIIENFSKIKLESQKSNFDTNCDKKKTIISNNNDSNMSNMPNISKNSNISISDNNGTSLLIDDYHLLLMLKGKRMKGYNNIKTKGFYFTFFIENKPLIIVEVVFSDKVSRVNKEKFNDFMKNIKIDEEVIIVFGYNPTKYFDVESGNYHKPIYEKLFFIDSSKLNPKVQEIFNQIYN